MSSPFRTWNGVPAHELFPGVTLHALGGEQVLLCRVDYAAGTTVARHSHPEAEQIVLVLDGRVDVTVGEERRSLAAGDLAVINRGVPHELYSEAGCSFMEALSPVPRDHVPDAERDLVLGEQGAALHVER